jgi:hypothetical protein
MLPTTGKKKGLMKAFISNTNSSKRTRLCKEMMDDRLDNVQKQEYSWRTQKKKDAKQKKIDSIPSVEVDPTSLKITPNVLEKIPHFYHPNWTDCREQYSDTFSKKQDSDAVLDADDEEEFQGISAPSNPAVLIEQKNIFGKNQLQVINTLHGSKLMETDTVPIFILLPRKMIDDQHVNAHADVQHLKKILSRYSKKKKDSRGEKKTGFCNSYATIGAHARRGGRGMSVTDASKIKCCQESFNHLNQLTKRMEFFGKQVLPFGLLSTIKDVRQSVNDTMSLTSTTGGEERIWASLATSYNYMSPAHVDDDAFLTVLTVSYVPYIFRNKKYFYKDHINDLPVACYMCFPELGIAVGLRPGDVIFFNPHYYHCVSGRTIEYDTEIVYVTSFYMKSMQLGLNDNSIGIDNVENCDTEGGDDGLTNIAVISDESPKFYIETPYGDIPTEIEATICTPPEDMWTEETLQSERVQLEVRMKQRINEYNGFSTKDMDREEIVFLPTDDCHVRFSKRHALRWSYEEQRKALIEKNERLNEEDRHEFQNKEQEKNEYESLLFDTYPIFYEGISGDQSVTEGVISDTETSKKKDDSDCDEKSES